MCLTFCFSQGCSSVNQDRSAGPNILSFTPTNIAETPLPLITQRCEPSLSPTTQRISSENFGKYGIPEYSSLTVTSGLASRLFLLDKDPFVIFLQARVAEGKPVPSNTQIITALKYILNTQISGKREPVLYKKETKKIESHIVYKGQRISSDLVCFDPVLRGEYYLVGVVETTNEEFLCNAKIELLESNKYSLKLDLDNLIK
jgi:hypothetical protein